MIWVPLGVLIGGVVLACLVFGFGAYEINWKKNRLRADLARLEQVNTRLTGIQSDLSAAQARMAAAQHLITERRP